ncbi:MAG: hypothetical protein JWM28_1181 [Chitinophagaceae bacterium]|nr:hypothetical protein [Chitinophagaceae bacterium]
MNKIWTLLFLITATLFARAQNTESLPVASTPDELLKFKEVEHDFAKIPQGKPVFHFFDITNTGKEPLKLDNVQASCGCTTPEWSHDPIPPGATAQIKVGYNAASEGVFEKFITVTYNGTQSKQIKIKGTVWKAPAGAAPANSSIQFLKQQNL